jgi:hypothetical protein
MAFDLHTVSVVAGSSALSNPDRLKIGFLTGVAILALAIGEPTGVEILNPGSFTSAPAVAGGSGAGATFTPSLAPKVVAEGAAGTTYAPSDTVTLTGGTASQQTILEVLTTKVVTAPAIAAAGTGVAPGDVIAGAGTGVVTDPTFTVTDTQAVSATVVNGGTGGTPGAVTLTGTTGTGTKFQATGTINGSGVLTGALVVSVAGDYTVNPTAIAAEPVTNNASATGIVVAVVMGAKTVSLTSGGVFSANNTTAGGITQGSTSGTGTGTTFTLTAAKYGVNTFAVQNVGSYSVLPSSPVAQGSTSGSGTGFTLAVSAWQLVGIATAGGQGYKNGDALAITGGGTDGTAAAEITTAPIGEEVAVVVNGFAGLPASFSVFVQPNGRCTWDITNKNPTGFTATFRPAASGEAIVATAFDAFILA